MCTSFNRSQTRKTRTSQVRKKPQIPEFTVWSPGLVDNTNFRPRGGEASCLGSDELNRVPMAQGKTAPIQKPVLWWLTVRLLE
jgi:hypothetical protein